MAAFGFILQSMVGRGREVSSTRRLNLESRIDTATGEALGKLGHKVEWWPEWTWLAGAVCTIVADKQTGVLKAGADPRRPSYAVGL